MKSLSGYAVTLSVAAMIAMGPVPGAGGARADETDQGQRVFKSANCVGCHKWSGEGGGGYGGAAANLRRTSLDLAQIEQTIRCGRPSTGMPHFEEDAYSDGHCYGLKKAMLTPATMPPEPDHPLRPADIDAVAHYVLTHVKGQGAPTYAQCQAFFGNGTRACDAYQKAGGDVTQADASPAGSQAAESPHGRMSIETAPDANAGSAGK